MAWHRTLGRLPGRLGRRRQTAPVRILRRRRQPDQAAAPPKRRWVHVTVSHDDGDVVARCSEDGHEFRVRRTIRGAQVRAVDLWRVHLARVHPGYR